VIGWWVGAAAAAGGDDGAWWVGLPVADVLLEAPEGGLPEQNLEALLRVADGEPLDPHDVRLDLATLFQVGEFSAVEARVDPFTTFDEEGREVAGVLLTYVVAPAPRVARLRVLGAEAFDRPEVEDALGIDVGEVFYPEVDSAVAEARLEGWLVRQGWRGGDVRIQATEPEPGRTYVVVEVDPGRPDTLDSITFVGDLEGVVDVDVLERWARGAGLRVGAPMAPDAPAKAQDRIRERLGRVRRSLWRPYRGWIGSRVTPAVVPGPFPDGAGGQRDGVRVTVAIEPGSQLDLTTQGLGLSGRRKAEAALGLDHRLRITRGWLDDAPGRVAGFLQDRGYYSATATVEARAEERVQHLSVIAVRGGHHELGPSPDLRYVDLAFTWGDGAAEERRERKRDEESLQAVFDQASPDVLRRDVYTEAAMVVGAEAARQFLVDRGQLAAAVTVGEPELKRRTTLLNGLRAVVGAPLRVRITPHVTVAPGPVTRLEALDVVGVAPEAAVEWLADARESAVGGPYSPQDLDGITRRLVEAHRAVGYLEATASVRSEAIGDLARGAIVTVEPGPLVLLRSALVRGAVRTRDPFLQSVVDAPVGQPVTTDTLETIRGDLYDLGIFRTVQTDLLGDEPARDLLVTVDEVAPWVLEGGAGLSTDQGVRLFGRATRANLFGVAHRLELFGQLGLDYRSEDIRDWLPDVFNPEWRAAVSYTAPRFPSPSQEVVFDVILRERVQERTWRMDRTGGGVGLQTRFDALRTEVRLGARLENRQLNQLDTAALLDGEPWDELLGDEPVLPSPWRWQESLTSLVVVDLRDDPIQPRKGALFSLNGEAAPGLPWPDQPVTTFLKGEVRGSFYVPTGPVTLQLSGRGAHVRSLGDNLVPLEDRFRLGGTNSLRGFVRDGVGPQNNAPRVSVDWPTGIGPVIDQVLRDDPDRWTPTGGDVLAQGTMELLVPLTALGMADWEGYSTEVFWDVGNVWMADPRAEPTTEARNAMPALRHGVGLGFQSVTPIGPLQLDLALNPQAAFLGEPARTLLVTELEEPVWRAHLTLGATF
jgi:outer membrane protein assembly factor BamA